MSDGYWIVPAAIVCAAVAVFSVAIGMSVGGNMGDVRTKSELQTQAIERGYGLYCPTTGRFAWRGECEESE